MEEYNLQEIRIEDYNSIKEYYQMRRPETADSNILDLYIIKIPFYKILQYLK